MWLCRPLQTNHLFWACYRKVCSSFVTHPVLYWFYVSLHDWYSGLACCDLIWCVSVTLCLVSAVANTCHSWQFFTDSCSFWLPFLNIIVNSAPSLVCKVKRVVMLKIRLGFRFGLQGVSVIKPCMLCECVCMCSHGIDWVNTCLPTDKFSKIWMTFMNPGCAESIPLLMKLLWFV